MHISETKDKKKKKKTRKAFFVYNVCIETDKVSLSCPYFYFRPIAAEKQKKKKQKKLNSLLLLVFFVSLLCQLVTCELLL